VEPKLLVNGFQRDAKIWRIQAFPQLSDMKTYGKTTKTLNK
jgi:hypothetical protein